jgi:hypothetical protein
MLIAYAGPVAKKGSSRVKRSFECFSSSVDRHRQNQQSIFLESPAGMINPRFDVLTLICRQFCQILRPVINQWPSMSQLTHFWTHYLALVEHSCPHHFFCGAGKQFKFQGALAYLRNTDVRSRPARYYVHRLTDLESSCACFTVTIQKN